MTPPIRLVALDMAGTTVADDGAVEEAFQRALDAVGLTAASLRGDPREYVRRTMGQSKIEVFTELLGGDRHRAARANTASRLQSSSRAIRVAANAAANAAGTPEAVKCSGRELIRT